MSSKFPGIQRRSGAITSNLSSTLDRSRQHLLIMDSESSITTFPRHLWWINFLNAWSWRLSTGDTGPIYGPFTVSFVLNVHKASFPAMVTEGPDCLISADFLGTYRGLLSMQHRAIKCTVPEGICTVVDYDGSAPCSKARRLVNTVITKSLNFQIR